MQKLTKNSVIKYIRKNYNGVMFEVLKDTNDLISQENLKTCIKYLNVEDCKGPYYTCQFCGIIHKGYYIDGLLSIDFKPITITAENNNENFKNLLNRN